MKPDSPAGPADASAFARLAVELHDAPGVVETVEAVVQFALQAENCAYAGVVLRTQGGEIEIGAVTDPIVEKFYTAQIIAEDGPMWQSLESSSTVYIPAVGADSRWPAWQALVTDAGIRSVLHVPMKAGGATIGVLSLYTRQPHAFSPDDEAIAHILAQHASVAVATTRQEAALSSAIDARKMVGQAMGMLMERFDLDGDQAFAVLRRYSQDNNVKLHDAAHHFVDTRSSHSSEGRRGDRP